VMVSEGDPIKEDQPLMEVETDKAAVEIPSPYAGVAQKVHVKAGDTVNVGAVLVTFSGDGVAAGRPADKKTERAAAPAPKAEKAALAREAHRVPMREEAPAEEVSPAWAPTRASALSADIRKPAAAPATRKLARELGVDLADVDGSGPGGRITKEDVEKAARDGRSQPAPSAPAAPLSEYRAPKLPPGEDGEDKWGRIRVAKLSQIRKTIAAQMARSVYTAPQVTGCDDADVTALDQMRRDLKGRMPPGVNLTAMPFIAKAVAHAAALYPDLNCSFDADAGTLIYKQYVNIGIAVDTERGLIVPVIRNVERMGIVDVARALGAIAERIRTNEFAIDDLRGGTFTISNYGAIGGTVSTPIVNYPEAAILGVGRAAPRPVVVDGQIVVRTILSLSLSIDHRATDGAQATRFLREVIGYLENPGRFLVH